MIDFNSFIDTGDIITINGESELEALLHEFEEADVRFGSFLRTATMLNIRCASLDPIMYVMLFRSSQMGLYFKIGLSSPDPSNSRQYTVPEILQLKVPELPDPDFEPMDESNLREFFGL